MREQLGGADGRHRGALSRQTETPGQRTRAAVSRLEGWMAWWIWGAAHVYFLVSLRNRVIVVTQWLWSYFVFERGARLITGR